MSMSTATPDAIGSFAYNQALSEKRAGTYIVNFRS